MQEGLEKLDRGDLVVLDKSGTRGNSKKLKKSVCRRDIKKYSFPYRSKQHGMDLTRRLCVQEQFMNLRPIWIINIMETGQNEPSAAFFLYFTTTVNCGL